MAQFISRTNLAKWLNTQIQKYETVAPRLVDGVLLYKNVENINQIVWEFDRPVMSIKDVFFPATERLALFEQNNGAFQQVEYYSDEKTIVFGVRPCDIRGLKSLDAVFIDTEPSDRYYQQHREQTTIIGLACNKMGETCFCTSVGSAPNDPNGMDILLTELEDGYIVDLMTDKGTEKFSGLETIERSVNRPEPILNQDLPIIPKNEWPPLFLSKAWGNISERCISCRICAYVCPTCRCFDVRDEVIKTENGKQISERIRCWDSCAGDVYRQIAGGHNPRADKSDRLRNRFFCKFFYFPEQYGLMACTGCGRCIDSCPVNIDITEIQSQLLEVST